MARCKMSYISFTISVQNSLGKNIVFDKTDKFMENSKSVLWS